MAIEPPETLSSDDEIVACDGGDGALGHPRVWLNMEGRGGVQCPYCGRLYVLRAPHGHGHPAHAR